MRAMQAAKFGGYEDLRLVDVVNRWRLRGAFWFE